MKQMEPLWDRNNSQKKRIIYGYIGDAFTRVTGHVPQKYVVFTPHIGEFTVDDIENVKIEIAIENENRQKTVSIIRNLIRTGHPGKGKMSIVLSIDIK